MTNIFLPNGRVNTDLDPSEIPEDRRSQYVALAHAQIACEQAESDQKTADDAVAEAVKIHDRAHAAVPRSTFMDEWRRSR
jgi:hypothetical protein